MEYKTEIKNCQNCKKDFMIEADDFGFYEKVKVPPPTFCPWCRFIRRIAFRNEKLLYRRTCDLCQKNIIAMYHKSVPFPVYCNECWYGDGWDPTSYGRSYDMTKNFFEQYKELSKIVPRFAMWWRNVINCDYSNLVAESRNVYLSTSVILESENVFYSKTIDKCSDVIDCMNMKESQSICENIDGEKNYNCQYLLLSRNCIDSYYLVDCVDCSNCFLSSNLRSKKFCIRNRQYTKEDYFKELEKFNLKSRTSRELLFKEFEEIKKKAIYRYANIIKCVNVTGNNLLNVKNSKNCFEVYDAENLNYCYRFLMSAKDSLDVSFAMKSELLYEYTTGALNAYNVKFSNSTMNSGRNIDYTEYCMDCNDIFGCISLKNKENAILNKVYSKEEFRKLREQIIKQMDDTPFKDKAGRVYKYGEFFPVELSAWAYNETLAQEIMPISKEEAEKNGYSWRKPDVKSFNITISAGIIPDNIDEVSDAILKEVLGCAHEGKCEHKCNVAFRLTDYELKFYKKHDVPLPILCSNCRYYERIKAIPALKLWQRNCMCDRQGHFHGMEKCKVVFETAYAPQRPEKIYCEKCYQQEVY